MGTLVVAAFAVLSAIVIGLLNAWARAEISAHYEPLITWFIRTGCNRFAEEDRADHMAEVLAMNSAIRSPTRRLWDAASFCLLATRAARAANDVRRSSAELFYYETTEAIIACIGTASLMLGTLAAPYLGIDTRIGPLYAVTWFAGVSLVASVYSLYRIGRCVRVVFREVDFD
ncbi:hypothetical protein ACQR09_25060 [Bradyrhizobium oligotrophicum]|uniref:hypothetical protein n=1 Tax=Bradyrhizobium oligotrophicum TaxID=44255 RepID=UPI003EC12F40